MLYFEGVSYLLEDDPDRAAPVLARALEVAAQVGAPPVTAMILAEQCSLAAQRNSWSEVHRWPSARSRSQAGNP